MSAFFAMDGYAVFVWPAYGLTLLGMVGLIGLAVRRRKAAETRLKRLETGEAEP